MERSKKNFVIERHDRSNDNSLRPWSAADEYLISDFSDFGDRSAPLGIYHDRFGYLSCHLAELSPIIVTTLRSQEKAILANFNANSLSNPDFHSPLEKVPIDIGIVLMKIPKSLGLFKLFLQHIAMNSTDNVEVVCSFMTRHFSLQLLEIAGEYFENVEQSRAIKKARLLKLSKKIHGVSDGLLTTLNHQDIPFQQYLGVFSSSHIDHENHSLRQF